MYFSNFKFAYADNEVKESTSLLTPVIVPEENSEGGVNLVTRFVERFMSPLTGLSFSDFSLSSLIKSGISPKSLALTHDVRLGFDAEIDSFNERLESIATDLFDSNE